MVGIGHFRGAQFATLVVGNQTISAFEPGVYDLRDYVFDESGSLDNHAGLIVGLQSALLRNAMSPPATLRPWAPSQIVRVDEEVGGTIEIRLTDVVLNEVSVEEIIDEDGEEDTEAQMGGRWPYLVCR